MRRAPGLETTARFDVNLSVGGLLDQLLFSPNAPVTVVRDHVRFTSEIGALVFAGEDAVLAVCLCVVGSNSKQICQSPFIGKLHPPFILVWN
ncbi:jg5812 [Pararge aegeria aegeria]|uniref:Jg5812 protein n=1 Tax=Pararge aegeria aegeria TaxID=348720 RepID=A0A8S4R7N4_9NEOP|nr:jg5812 [Pararge aegeria aegeria]